jgi:Mn-containing catalase
LRVSTTLFQPLLPCGIGQLETFVQDLGSIIAKGENVSILKEVLVEELQDLLHAENHLTKALPKMARAAKSAELKSAFEQHTEQTKGHVDRLQQVFELLGAKAKTKPCKGMQGLVEEGQEKITEGQEKEDVAADLGLIAAAQKVEHYEISRMEHFAR